MERGVRARPGQVALAVSATVRSGGRDVGCARGTEERGVNVIFRVVSAVFRWYCYAAGQARKVKAAKRADRDF